MTMKYKNELEMWHQFAEFAEELREVATFNIIGLVKMCKNYSYDFEACEEYCSRNAGLTLTKDFDSLGECWKCPHYQTGKVKKSK